MVNKNKNINKEVQDFNSLQKSTHYRVTWEILQKIKSVRTTLIACAACIALTYLSTSYVIIKYGSIVWSMESSVSLRIKNDANIKKQRELKESILVFEALAFDDSHALKESETANSLRRGDTYGEPHIFTIDKWNRRWRPKILERAIATKATNILTHITSQDNWHEKISDELAADVYEAIKPNLNNVANEYHNAKIAELVAENNLLKKDLDDERRKKRVLLAEKFDRPCYLDGSRPAHTEQIHAETTLNTLRGFKTDRKTLCLDGKIKLLEYIDQKN